MKTIRSIAAAVVASFMMVTANAQSNVTHVQAVIPDNADELCALVDDWFHAKLNADFDAMRAAMSEEFMVFGVDAEPYGAEQYIDLWRMYSEANSSQGIKSGVHFAVRFPDGEYSGDWVYYTAEATWTMKGSDQPVNSWFTMIARVDNGEITLAYQFQDNLPIMMQMGFTITPPASMTEGSGE